ncbi:hypothetical protein EDC96DRAFT_307521 [Choanephora cucurbitarum]|nr:hypothetical protein EDC96DRAFT_307521 [Choanephora cucurbitarum]
MADQSSPLQQSQPPPQDDYPPPPPPPPASSGMPSSPTGRSPPRGGRDRSLSPRRSPSRGRYYDDNRRSSYRDDDRYSSRGRYDPYSRRDDYYDSRDRYSDRYYQDRYDHHHHRGYDHRDRYHDRYDDRRGGGGGGGGRYPPKSRQRRPVDRGTEQERKSTTTIYAGNLPYDFIERDVASMFERYGRLKSITVPMDNMTNKNKGFAFVEFEERRDAEDAYEKFDGFSVEGRRLRLDW